MNYETLDEIFDFKKLILIIKKSIFIKILTLIIFLYGILNKKFNSLLSNLIIRFNKNILKK